MLNKPDFKILDNIIIEENLNFVVQTLFNEIKAYLDLVPFNENFKIKIIKNKITTDLEYRNILNFGVNRYDQDNVLIIEIYENYQKFLSFILLREIYNLFVPIELKDYESIQMVINQIIMIDLSKHKTINEWRSIIRENLVQYDFLSLGFDRLNEFDRLDQFFKGQRRRTSITPTQFFFKYIRMHKSIIHERIEYIHNLFFDEYEKYFLKKMVNDELIETLRCLIIIFYDVKHYKNLLSYKKYFQEFKENKKIQTELSLRKFSKYMDWIKTETFISPNYHLNYKTINLCLVIIYLKFNPLLNKGKIYSIIDKLPFFSTPKFSYNGFALELLGYVVVPKVYLEDFLRFIERMKKYGFIMKHQCLAPNDFVYTINLNYFKEYSQSQCLINPNHREYNKKYIIEFKIDFGNKFFETELSLLDFLIIDRIRFYSISGFGFERRSEILQTLKSDLLNTITTQSSIIKNLKNTLKFFYSFEDLRTELIKFIEANKKFGFFFIKTFFDDLLILVKLLNKILSSDLKINNIFKFQDLIENKKVSYSIEENILLNNKEIKKIIYEELVPIFFKSKLQYHNLIEKYKNFYELFNSCYNLKLFNLNVIQEILEKESLVDTLYNRKDQKFNKIYNRYKLRNITSREIDKRLGKFLNHKPPQIQPKIITTIPITQFREETFELILIESQETRNFLDKLKNIYPNVSILQSKNISTDKNNFFVEIYSPYLTTEEKEQLFSFIYNNLKENILYGKFYLWSGYIQALSSKNFYDFDQKKFFYTKDLYEQFFQYIQKIFGPELTIHKKRNFDQKNRFWSNEKSMINLVKKVNDRFSRENFDFNIIHLNKLLDFHLNLKNNLQDTLKFKDIKRQYFFKNYIKSIKIIPRLQNFKFSQYYLYIHPTNIEELDFKLLFINTFQKILYPPYIDDSNSFFIKYIIPHNKPNLKYLNWLTKAKKIISEYCAFVIKKIYQICHFSNNLGPEGWIYDKDRFKIYMQNILFNPDYNIQIPEVKEFLIADKSISSYFEPESPEYVSLTSIYNWKSIDIKSYLGTQKHSIINHIKNLLKRDLIIPYLSLKNLDLHNKIYIIIPNVKQELNETFVKIFSFFNYGFIYEIEGEYFIYEFPEEVNFENGLMIKLYLPKCELHEFIRLFNLLFEYLEIKDYLILNDLVDGSQLIKSIYGSLDFLKKYNPLKNLIWNPNDKKWMNHKLFTQKFEPIYPDLLPKEDI
ncbi:MAG: hypothetical protein ACFFB0_01295 [Promethearchaeota archaeon]